MENNSVNTQQIIASGGLFLAKKTKRFLFLLRTQGRTAGTWGLVGGRKEPSDATPFEALRREIEEEIGFLPVIKKTLPLEKFVSNDSVFNFHTYFCLVDTEFVPTLSDEHIAWGWFSLVALPKPIHRGLNLSLRNKIIQTKIQTVIDIIDSL
jgi:8-oxo-dGTP pyrophosphatase MutT (NUDIX family)